MVVLDVSSQDQVLTGTAPKGAGETFRILNGVEVLWEGKNGESFRILPHCRKLCLVSVDSENKAWDIKWQSELNNRAMTTHSVVMKGDKVPTDGTDAGPALRKMIANAGNMGYEKQQATIELPRGEYHFYPESAT